MRDAALSSYWVVETIKGLVLGFILHPPAGISANAFTDEIASMIHRHLTAAS